VYGGGFQTRGSLARRRKAARITGKMETGALWVQGPDAVVGLIKELETRDW